ncbi:MAG: DUF1573 domain-containing protein [Flavobacteriaceae bacterium]|nr:DUF1573 domain-containing protein [Flavobacteriaceae bacterium]
MHDFGFVKPNTLLATIFRLTNQGGTSFQVEKAEDSCGFTVPKFEAREFEQREFIDVPVEMNASDPWSKNHQALSIRP